MTPVEFGADVVVDISDHCMVSMMKILIQQFIKNTAFVLSTHGIQRKKSSSEDNGVQMGRAICMDR